MKFTIFEPRPTDQEVINSVARSIKSRKTNSVLSLLIVVLPIVFSMVAGINILGPRLNEPFPGTTELPVHIPEFWASLLIGLSCLLLPKVFAFGVVLQLGCRDQKLDLLLRMADMVRDSDNRARLTPDDLSTLARAEQWNTMRRTLYSPSLFVLMFILAHSAFRFYEVLARSRTVWGPTFDREVEKARLLGFETGVVSGMMLGFVLTGLPIAILCMLTPDAFGELLLKIWSWETTPQPIPAASASSRPDSINNPCPS